MNIAVVIPALNEASAVEGAVLSALGPHRGSEPETQLGPKVWVEVIVVDGGSLDDTRERAQNAGARVVNAQCGRARQLQVGFEESKSDVILFLHADTRLPEGWRFAVSAALSNPEFVGGAFRLKFDDSGFRMRSVEWTARLRIALLRVPFGDQALFVRREVLHEIGGIRDVPVMEDIDLVQAMKKRGRLALLPLPALTSARRYLDGGVLRVSVMHFFAFAAWALGIERKRIAGWLGR